jgi:integrase
MPKRRAHALETPTARAKLAVRKKVYAAKLAPNMYLGYRRNHGPGTWSVRVTGAAGRWLKRIALADDLEPAAPPAVLTYWQAVEAARKLARGQGDDGGTRPLTVAEALDRYEADLKARQAEVYNATRARLHLAGTALAVKPVQLVTAVDLKRWRDTLLAKGLAAATVNRTRSCLRAALELAGAHDHRIRNQGTWKTGLKGLPDAAVARNCILPDATVRQLVRAAYQHSHRVGVLVDVLAVTGARPGQVARLLVEDFKDDERTPRLLMPRSGKGGTQQRVKRKAERYQVPITTALAAVLRAEAAGRAPAALLLLRPNGAPWGRNPHAEYRKDWRTIVAACGLNPDEVTAYALRHSSIVRALLANVPVRVVAAQHDSGIGPIERNYSRHISAHADELTRRALLNLEPPTTNVVALRS